MIQDLDGATKRFIRLPKRKRYSSTLAWSRDGSAIALVRWDARRRNSDVYVAVVADRTLRRVAHLPGFAGVPRWSPDGTQIAFDWESRRACDPGTTGTTAIYVADAGGGGARRLVSVEPKRPSTERTPYFNVLDWSPDGTRLLYGNEVWRTGGDCGVGTSDDQLSASLLHVATTGGRPTVIPTGDSGQGEWSSDGQLIAFCGDGVTVARRDGRVVRRWPNHYNEAEACGAGSDRWLTWSPSGEEVYAATSEQVVALRVRNGQQRTLLDLTPIAKCTGDFNCAIVIRGHSQDGRFLLVEAEGGERDLDAMFLLSTDGTQRYRLPDSYRKRIPYGAAIFLL